ncbi:MAG TPA: molybdopterin-dependent oxidoreductase, partial [Verrucomicrobiota bacterium]|nr:molybdopterin-dependent oxidoreductase [Verrucomicrobiota bacterium]
TPRENDAVNSCWMCDFGRLNYKWINRKDRISTVLSKSANGVCEEVDWQIALEKIARYLKNVKIGTSAIIASARLSNEELWLLSKLKKLIGATSDSVPRFDNADNFLLKSDRNPNTNGAILTGICSERIGENLENIKKKIERGELKTLIVFGEDVVKIGITPQILGKLDMLVVSDILPNATTPLANYLLPGCAAAEKSGTFTNINLRVQKFNKAIEPPGKARPEYEFLSELLGLMTDEKFGNTAKEIFDKMVADVVGFNKMNWSKLGDTGMSVEKANQ